MENIFCQAGRRVVNLPYIVPAFVMAEACCDKHGKTQMLARLLTSMALPRKSEAAWRRGENRHSVRLALLAAAAFGGVKRRAARCVAGLAAARPLYA